VRRFNLKGLVFFDLKEGIIASGAILYYLSETQHNRYNISPRFNVLPKMLMWMDRFTIRNLELYHSYNPNAVTLLDVIDKTLSPMGGRLLKRWFSFKTVIK
jgi:DNA mismatch repair protein MutS